MEVGSTVNNPMHSYQFSVCIFSCVTASLRRHWLSLSVYLLDLVEIEILRKETIH